MCSYIYLQLLIMDLPIKQVPALQMVKQQLKQFLQFVIKVNPKQFKYYILLIQIRSEIHVGRTEINYIIT